MPCVDSLALYIHWPFCARKCPYCDYNSHVRAQIDHAAWRDALLAEMRYYHQHTQGRRLHSIFFGGGTPSTMPLALVAALIAEAENLWGLTPDCEITLEANPSFLADGYFRDLRGAGVNRVSLGIQALNDHDLQFLGRDHDSKRALAMLHEAAGVFERYSFDLIFGRPEQTIAAWDAELRQALGFGSKHLALYQLTIEPDTGFAVPYARGDWQLPADDVQADMYVLTVQMAADRGLQRYEVSNFATPGEECRHNQTYWRYQEYIGIGPGAHGRLVLNATMTACSQIKNPEKWLQQVQTYGHGSEPYQALSMQSQVEELLMLGLRTVEGVALSRFQAITSQDFTAYFGVERLQPLMVKRLLHSQSDRLVASDAGLTVLNYLERQLLT